MVQVDAESEEAIIGHPDAVQAARIETRAEALQEAAAYVRLRGHPQLAADILTIPGASPTVTDGEK